MSREQPCKVYARWLKVYTIHVSTEHCVTAKLTRDRPLLTMTTTDVRRDHSCLLYVINISLPSDCHMQCRDSGRHGSGFSTYEQYMNTQCHFDRHLRYNHDFNSLKTEIMLWIKIYDMI